MSVKAEPLYAPETKTEQNKSNLSIYQQFIHFYFLLLIYFLSFFSFFFFSSWHYLIAAVVELTLTFGEATDRLRQVSPSQ